MATYNSYPFDEGTGSYLNETRWSEFFDWMRTVGVLSEDTTLDPTGELAVTEVPVPLGTQVQVTDGEAYIKGFIYIQTDGPDVLGITANTSGNPRIDLVVCRKDTVADEVFNFVIEGDPDISPVAPSPIQNSTIWDLPLAEVYVADGTTAITSGDITDVRVRSTQGDGGSTAVTFSNAGTTSLVASTSSPPDLRTKGLIAGTNISFSTSGTDVTISASSAPTDSPVCILYRDSNQTVSAGMSAAISWSDAILNPDALWVSGTDITIAEEGLYEVITNVEWTGSATSNGTVTSAIRVNGTTVGSSSVLAVGSVVVSNNVAVLADLDVSDVVTILAINDSGVSLDVKTNGIFSPYVALLKVRS